MSGTLVSRTETAGARLSLRASRGGQPSGPPESGPDASSAGGHAPSEFQLMESRLGGGRSPPAWSQAKPPTESRPQPIATTAGFSALKQKFSQSSAADEPGEASVSIRAALTHPPATLSENLANEASANSRSVLKGSLANSDDPALKHTARNAVVRKRDHPQAGSHERASVQPTPVPTRTTANSAVNPQAVSPQQLAPSSDSPGSADGTTAPPGDSGPAIPAAYPGPVAAGTLAPAAPMQRRDGTGRCPATAGTSTESVTASEPAPTNGATSQAGAVTVVAGAAPSSGISGAATSATGTPPGSLAGSPPPGHAAAAGGPAHVPAANDPGLGSASAQLASSAGRQIALALTRADNSHAAPIIVRLQPRELGDLEVRITVQPSGTHIQVTAERRDTYESLLSGHPEIVRQLADAGVSLGNGGLDLRHGSGEQPARQSNRAPAGAPSASVQPAQSTSALPRSARGLLDIVA